jgi:hypothetical protein
LKKSGILLLIMLLFAGCLKNPLSTRDAQVPAGTTGTWETPSTPEVVISNLMFAYIEKNIQNYQLCLAENFYYSAYEDSIEAEAQGNGYLFHDWSKEVEVSVTENIFSAFSVTGRHLDLILSSSNDYPDSLGDTLAVLYRNYILRSIIADSLGMDTVRFEGVAAFHLSQSLFSLWSICLWEEMITAQTGYDWGDFKAEFRTR